MVNNAEGHRLVQHIPMIMTRPAPSNSAFISQLPVAVREKLSIIENPLIRIRQLGVDPHLTSGEAVIFTSSNAVNAVPDGEGRTAYCVGERTSQTALKAGWQAQVMGRNVEELIAGLKKIGPQFPLCHLRGKHIRQDIVDALSPQGFDVRQVAVYDQELLPLGELARHAITQDYPVIVTLFSPRTAQHFAASVVSVSQLHILALSDAVADECARIDGTKTVVAERPDAQAMVFEIEKIVHKLRLG